MKLIVIGMLLSLTMGCGLADVTAPNDPLVEPIDVRTIPATSAFSSSGSVEFQDVKFLMFRPGVTSSQVARVLQAGRDLEAAWDKLLFDIYPRYQKARFALVEPTQALVNSLREDKDLEKILEDESSGIWVVGGEQLKVVKKVIALNTLGTKEAQEFSDAVVTVQAKALMALESNEDIKKLHEQTVKLVEALLKGVQADEQFKDLIPTFEEMNSRLATGSAALLESNGTWGEAVKAMAGRFQTQRVMELRRKNLEGLLLNQVAGQKVKMESLVRFVSLFSEGGACAELFKNHVSVRGALGMTSIQQEIVDNEKSVADPYGKVNDAIDVRQASSLRLSIVSTSGNETVLEGALNNLRLGDVSVSLSTREGTLKDARYMAAGGVISFAFDVDGVLYEARMSRVKYEARDGRVYYKGDIKGVDASGKLVKNGILNVIDLSDNQILEQVKLL